MNNNSLESIYSCLDQNKSFCFNSGAGSGKTYSLIKTIEYIINSKDVLFKDQGQKILVITYTNAAADEIRARLGNTDSVEISTIHDMLWRMIKPFQNDLVSIHKDNIREQIAIEEEKISTNRYVKDITLDSYVEDKEFKDFFWKTHSLKAKEYKKQFIEKYNITIDNVNDFKKYFKSQWKILKYYTCIHDIEQGNRKKINYNTLINYDRLEKMEFSHDTLLMYAEKFYSNNKIAKRIFSNSYPIILIDEYQDTNPLVFSMLNNIRKSNPSIIIGVYGDVHQNIYEKGIGSGLNSIFDDLEIIQSQQNRRSLANVVEIANKVRHDGLVQIPTNIGIGETHIYSCNDESSLYQKVEDIVKHIVDSNPNSEIGCLFLKNDMVAKKNDFYSYYRLLSETPYYKNHFEQIGTEILNSNYFQLGRVPAKIFKIIELLSIVKEDSKQVIKYIPKTVYAKLNYQQLKSLVDTIKAIEGDQLADIINAFVAVNTGDVAVVLREWFGEEFYLSIQDFKDYLIQCVYTNTDESENEKANEWADEFVAIDYSELFRWFSYISGKTENVNYLTFHGSKGREFDNLVIAITNEFNHKKDYFRSYFNNVDGISEEIEKRRNLLYVAITRSKKNLYVIYQDELFDTIADGFEKIFGTEINRI